MIAQPGRIVAWLVVWLGLGGNRGVNIDVATDAANVAFPRGVVEKKMLLESADMVAPDRVYDIYQEIIGDPIAMVTMEKVCANPWTYPNLLRDPRFIAEVRRDGRFIEFLKQFGLIPSAPEA